MNKSITKKNLTPCIDCACFNIRKASRVVTQYFMETMQPSGLRSTQFTILAMLAASETLTISELAERLVVDRTTLTRNLGPLEKQGLVKAVSGTDRRTRTIILTPQGYKTLTQALPLWKKAQQGISAYLGKDRFHHLLKELRFIEKMAAKM